MNRTSIFFTNQDGIEFFPILSEAEGSAQCLAGSLGKLGVKSLADYAQRLGFFPFHMSKVRASLRY